jgi:hypothetical protein
MSEEGGESRRVLFNHGRNGDRYLPWAVGTTGRKRGTIAASFHSAAAVREAVSVLARKEKAV